MLIPVAPHEVPAGPLAVRWHGYELPELRAGTTVVAQVDLENAGTVTWRPRAHGGVNVAYHWLDRFGNPIVWAGIFTPLPEPVEPGARRRVPLSIQSPSPPGAYRLAIDLIDEPRAWFAELGNQPLEIDVEVVPRIARRTLAVNIAEGQRDLVEETMAALAAQDESTVEREAAAVAFLAPGCRPAPDWSSRLLDAHEEGYAVVAGSLAVEGGLLERRRAGRALDPWRPGFGRAPTWSLPLLCPSIVTATLDGVEWADPVAGLPAIDPARLAEPALCDGRIRIDVAARALRPAARRSA